MADSTVTSREPRLVDFILSEETRAIQERTRKIGEEVIAPNAARWDAEASYPKEAIEALTEAGYMSMIIPKEYGGLGLSNVDLSVMLIEVNRQCASAGVVCSVHNSLCVYPIKVFGSDETKQRYLPKLASVDWLGGYCLTEPDAGSDAANQRTTAVKDGNEYVLNGSKIFITTGKEAGVFIVFARTSKEDKPAKGISCFVVEADSPGLTVGKVETKMGIKGSSTTEIHFEDVRVPAENLLGVEGRGFNIAMEILNGGRVGIACQAVGIHGGVLDDLNAFCNSHQRDGKPLAYQQDVAFTLSEITAEYDAGEALIYRAACARDRNPNPIRECSTAKLFTAQACNRAARRAMQIMGAEATVRGNRVERFYRDARITEIYEGTSEVQKIVIARTL